MKASISIDTSEELTANVPVTMHCHELVHSWATLQNGGRYYLICQSAFCYLLVVLMSITIVLHPDDGQIEAHQHISQRQIPDDHCDSHVLVAIDETTPEYH